MNRIFIMGLFIFIALSLAACGVNNADESSSAEEPQDNSVDEYSNGDEVKEKEIENENEEEKVQDEYTSLTDTEVKTIMVDNFEQIDGVMKGIQEEYYEWTGAEWIDDPSLDQVKFNNAAEITTSKLADFATQDFLEEEAQTYLIQYFTFYHTFILDELSLKVRFEVLEQSAEQFVVRAIHLDEEASYFSVGTNVITYVKEDEVWKLNKHEYINTEKQPLNLTFEDIEEHWAPEKIEFVEELSKDGETFILIRNGNYYEARNTATSMLDYEVANQYQSHASTAPTE